MFEEVVIPLLGVKDTALIGISTPLEASNFYSELVTAKKPNGKPMFNVLEISLLCDACKAEGKTTCPHSSELPPWKTGERQEMVKALMSDSAMYLREQMGIITTNDSSAFGKADVVRAFTPENRVVPSVVSHKTVFVCIDPCGGGASGLAIVAGGFTPSDTLVVRARFASQYLRSMSCDSELSGYVS